LTTVSWSRTELGREAATLLLTPLEGGAEEDEAPRCVIIPPRLVVRESCGAVAHDDPAGPDLRSAGAEKSTP
jgi:LacI family transcriptional regulator